MAAAAWRRDLSACAAPGCPERMPPLNALLSPPAPRPALRCRLAAHAALRAPAEILPALRHQPGPSAGAPLAPSFLKHAEDQSVVALSAVLRAVAHRDWAGRSFADWGVVAAPNFFGRHGIAQTVQKYAQEGAWGVSPHLIPQ